MSEYVNIEGPQSAYAMFVLNRLEKAKKEIKTIFPIAFRVEILENIFSLLFSMSNVLGDSLEACLDSDEGHEGEDLVMEAKAEVYKVIAQTDIALKNKISFETSQLKENSVDDLDSNLSITAIELPEHYIMPVKVC
ncbi:zinc finger FYVE domain-containing protein 26 [Caerostris extrusa]|uniref:Zinc finger FYVE domain-containing protein 26 n=1 Tax=Caerostris extrusa TaxID=172846 RepID=A0AAV4M8M3_CAEEX|nr:zinc finger FYVE domain-containing protein 26 [Caerostris extrusa]